MSSVSLNVHLYADDPQQLKTFDADGEHGPFVSLRLGQDFQGVTLMVRSEETLNDLAALVAEARASLAAAVNRAKQPELPVAS